MSKPRTHVGRAAAQLVNAPLAKSEPAPSLAPGVPAKFTYLLAAYRIERRSNEWYVSKSLPTFASEKPEWHGPYDSIDTATFAIARKLASECADRHTRDVAGHKMGDDHPLNGLKETAKLPRRKAPA